MTLYNSRNEKIFGVLVNYKIQSVIDFGCGDGKLLNFLYLSRAFKHLAGIEISNKRIEKAKRRFPENANIQIFHQSFFDYNSLFQNYEAIILSEVIEHLTPNEVDVILNIILEQYAPILLIITSPNRSFNVNFDVLHNGFRHSSHIFELSEEDAEEFKAKLQEKHQDYNIYREYCDIEQASHIIIGKRKNYEL